MQRQLSSLRELNVMFARVLHAKQACQVANKSKMTIRIQIISTIARLKKRPRPRFNISNFGMKNLQFWRKEII